MRADNLRNFLRTSLEAISQEKERCKKCSTYRKTANNGERYLCNHFSEYCLDCEEWQSQDPKQIQMNFHKQ